MEPKNYTVVKIEGEYAYLCLENAPLDAENLFIALALLPPAVDIGTKLRYEFPEYTIIG